MLDHTGERMIPEGSDALTFWEHVYRYRFATRFVRRKRALDVACGEGYGAHALLQAGAAQVTGVDISEEACAHARSKYGLDVHCADAAELPFEGGSFDAVVSFETIEHLPDPDRFLAECARVLAPDGLLIVSTPNRNVYGEDRSDNPFHCSEMTKAEFAGALQRHFDRTTLYSQCVRTAPWWTPRSLAAIDSPWFAVRGFWRLRRRVLPAALGDGHFGMRATEADRKSASAAILRRDSPFAALLNPLEVRPASRTEDEPATYFIALCRNPIRTREQQP